MHETLPRHDLSPGALKALAHPLRQKLLYHLAFVGPASATSVAEALGESSGSTSYHLRQLARQGLIEEIPERSRGRARWWRLIPLDLRGPTADALDSDEGRATADELGRIRLRRDRELVARYVRERERFGEWALLSMFSSSATRMTKDEFVRFTEDHVELLKRYWRPAEQCPPEAAPIAALFYAFPWPGE